MIAIATTRPDEMNISLPPELEKFVTDKIATGNYGTPEEVVSEGLLLLKQQDERPGFMYSSEDELREKIGEGMKALELGDISTRSVDELKEEARRRYEAGHGDTKG